MVLGFSSNSIGFFFEHITVNVNYALVYIKKLIHVRKASVPAIPEIAADTSSPKDISIPIVIY